MRRWFKARGTNDCCNKRAGQPNCYTDADFYTYPTTNADIPFWRRQPAGVSCSQGIRDPDPDANANAHTVCDANVFRNARKYPDQFLLGLLVLPNIL